MSMNKPKTTAERQKAFRETQKKRGLKEIRNLWSHPDDHETIKQFVNQLNNHRLGKMAIFEISMQGEMSERIESDSKINAVLKFAKQKGWGQEIGAQHHSPLQSSQYTVGNNKKGWYQVWVQEVD